MKFEEVNDLLKPGYLPFESGFQEVGDGKWTVAALTRMPGCRAKMIHWWFSWLGDIEWYRLWHPTDHVYSGWENRVGGDYIGASHLVHEYLAGKDGPLFKLRIDLMDPKTMFDPALYEASGHFAISARPGLLEAPIQTGYMCHFIRNTDSGCEMRSRFWLGHISHRDPAIAIPEAQAREMRKANLDREFARRLHQHAVEEMGYLAEILPVLYRRETLDNTF